MSRKITFYFIGLLFLALPLAGCKKVEGPGGAATIQGKIYIEEYDSGGNLYREYFADKFDVYIIYGDDPTETYFHDDIETSYDGSFKFRYLEPGNYRIFFYEDRTFAELIADPSLNKTKAIVMDVEINDKKEVVDMGTIVVYNRFN